MVSGKVGRGADQFPLRLPPGLREKVRQLSLEEKRSMNSQFISLIELGMFEVDTMRAQSGLAPLVNTPEERDLYESLSTSDIDYFITAQKLVLPARDSLTLFDKIELLTPDMRQALDKIVTALLPAP